MQAPALEVTLAHTIEHSTPVVVVRGLCAAFETEGGYMDRRLRRWLIKRRKPPNPHEPAPLLEHVTAPVGRLHLVRQRVRQRLFGRLARVGGGLGAPGAKGLLSSRRGEGVFEARGRCSAALAAARGLLPLRYTAKKLSFVAGPNFVRRCPQMLTTNLRL